jgi:hypothetical protein
MYGVSYIYSDEILAVTPIYQSTLLTSEMRESDVDSDMSEGKASSSGSY